jgi:hypothetical protein
LASGLTNYINFEEHMIFAVNDDKPGPTRPHSWDS